MNAPAPKDPTVDRQNVLAALAVEVDEMLEAAHAAAARRYRKTSGRDVAPIGEPADVDRAVTLLAALVVRDALADLAGAVDELPQAHLEMLTKAIGGQKLARGSRPG